MPIFDGTRPYQDIPFQFSLYVVRGEDSKPELPLFVFLSRYLPRFPLGFHP
ncbi:MAG: DUF2779 domain-containing protein [Desulfobacteraceae bacterium]|nr:DUF2779 domain-containing protein [Desulfobacteraceae bacterium]